MKHTQVQIEFVLAEMYRLQAEHPKASIYYDYESNEVRITYPLPPDFKNFTKHPGKRTGLTDY